MLTKFILLFSLVTAKEPFEIPFTIKQHGVSESEIIDMVLIVTPQNKHAQLYAVPPKSRKLLSTDLTFEIDSLNKPFGKAFSDRWIGEIDYSSQTITLFNRTLMSDFLKSKARKHSAWLKKFGQDHPEYGFLDDHPDPAEIVDRITFSFYKNYLFRHRHEDQYKEHLPYLGKIQ